MKLAIDLLDKKIKKMTKTFREKQKIWHSDNLMTKMT